MPEKLIHICVDRHSLKPDSGFVSAYSVYFYDEHRDMLAKVDYDNFVFADLQILFFGVVSCETFSQSPFTVKEIKTNMVEDDLVKYCLPYNPGNYLIVAMNENYTVDRLDTIDFEKNFTLDRTARYFVPVEN